MISYKKYFLLLFYVIHMYCSIHATVVVYTGKKYFSIPPAVKNLGLVGFTPHPTAYIKQYGYYPAKIQQLQLADFLDVPYVKDSFMRLLSAGKENNIDHLLIAYLPVHFVHIKALIPEHYAVCCTLFLNAIVPQIVNLIAECATNLNITYDISLFVPTEDEMATIPSGSISSAERNRYLVKELPIFENMRTSQVEVITIINNAHSSSNEDIIKYLQYEYLYYKKLEYRVIELPRKTFHKYIN